MTGPRKSIANLARLGALMDEAGLDGLVLRSGRNFTYLSGVVYPGIAGMDLTDSTRPVMLVWPRNGDPVIIANKIAAGLAQRDGWIEDIVLYEAYVDSPQETLAEVLRSMQLASGKVGFEKDYWSAAHWEAVKQALPGIKMGECTALMDRVRGSDDAVTGARRRTCWTTLIWKRSAASDRATPRGRCTPTWWAPVCASASSGHTGSSTCSGTPYPTAARATW
jgi:hypothetical protein